MPSVDHHPKSKIAVCVRLDGHLLADQAWFVAAAEDEHFDPSFAAARLEVEAAHQFPGCEIVGLIDHRDGVGRIRKPNPSQLDVAGDRIRATAIPSIIRCECSPEYPLRRVSPAASGIARTRRPTTPFAT
jgi:hypothetical protein